MTDRNTHLALRLPETLQRLHSDATARLLGKMDCDYLSFLSSNGGEMTRPSLQNWESDVEHRE